MLLLMRNHNGSMLLHILSLERDFTLREFHSLTGVNLNVQDIGEHSLDYKTQVRNRASL